VTFAGRTQQGPPPTRLDNLVNTNFNPNYGQGQGPQKVIIVILPALANFALNDGSLVMNSAGVTLPPRNSGLVGALLNNTNDCLVVYDTSQHDGNPLCVARAGSGGTLDLPFPNPAILYHELSHALRIVNNAQLATVELSCNAASAEETAAMVDENDLRTQTANAQGITPVLRDTGNHCGQFCSPGTIVCCIIASVASGSPFSEEVVELRAVRDGFLRKSEIGFSFFQSLHYDYYGFSPQVCTLMARHPGLRPLVLEGLVRPLVIMLRLVEEYSLGPGGAAILGEQFAAGHPDAEASTARLNMLNQAQDALYGKDAGLTGTQRELARLLTPSLASVHLRWTFVELIQIYQAALQSYLQGCTVERLGEQLYTAITSWASRMPLDDVWASLAAEEVRSELEMLECTLFHAAETKTRFRERLQEKFGAVTSVAAVLRERTPD
jgi:hypothetical protein